MKSKLGCMVGLVALLGFSSAAYSGGFFVAALSGNQEVPPVPTRAAGDATFIPLVEDGHLIFRLDLDGSEAGTLLGAAGAHIHCGAFGQNGPVVVGLAGEVVSGFGGPLLIRGLIDTTNIVPGSDCGDTFFELIGAMLEGNTYVNVHSEVFPSGEIRGQISIVP